MLPKIFVVTHLSKLGEEKKPGQDEDETAKTATARTRTTMMLIEILLLFLLPITSNSVPHLKSIIFEGGGVRGAAYSGAIVALEEAGQLSSITQFAGTSAGSTAATMLAVGYTACEFNHETMSTSFGDLVEFSLINRLMRAVVGHGTTALARLVGKQKGFFAGRKLEDAADIVIAKKLCSRDLNIPLSAITEQDLQEHTVTTDGGGRCSSYRRATFGQLNDANGGLFKLSLSSFDITNGTLVYFNVDTVPNMAISKAIRMSSSIPLVFEPLEHDGHLFVDGMLMRRLPIDAFKADTTMLALKINRDFVSTTPSALEKMSVGAFAYRILTAMAKQTQDLDLVQKSKKKGVHFVDFSGVSGLREISAIDFHLKHTQKVGMFVAGYSKMREFLESQGIKYTPKQRQASGLKALQCTAVLCEDVRNCSWLRNMKLQAIEKDERQRFSIKWYFSTWMFGMDPYMVVQLSVVFLVCMGISQVVTQSRNGIHKMLVENYSGTRTARCEHCLRSWMPSELPSSTIPMLPRTEIENALSARGIYFIHQKDGTLRQVSDSSNTPHRLPMKVPAKDEDADVDIRMRLRLHEAVWWENISLRRPWSWLSHSKYAPSVGKRCGHDCPINVSVTVFILIVWIAYVLSVITTV